ncbi:EF-hand superfamily Ca2+-modulated protein [Boeremia exigua]|uniref:EF-hand superfamily Ca2+-modulated protein n=1 Tax=Boeremia exigua TaxID=749465 RepID=UPI001E8E0EBD|nr:EF-hand superfamily Ca2+-modulated protein [Boeremia exigua]KAH6642220.1 EF-hand superfamily Ca2+-modulated protein [Boeremia exigua]
MPPKRRAAPAKARPAPKRASKLAKENGLNADQEAEIREAFGLFAVHHPEHEDSKEGREAPSSVQYLTSYSSLNLAPEKSEIPSILETIDPLNTGFVEFEPFFSYAAIAMHTKEAGSDEDMEDDDDDYRAESNAEEVSTGYQLFTHGGSGPITLGHLRRVAKELREDVPDEVLRDMILEANGGVRGQGKDVGGVTLEEFESVMKRAGLSFG